MCGTRHDRDPESNMNAWICVKTRNLVLLSDFTYMRHDAWMQGHDVHVTQVESCCSFLHVSHDVPSIVQLLGHVRINVNFQVSNDPSHCRRREASWNTVVGTWLRVSVVISTDRCELRDGQAGARKRHLWRSLSDHCR